MKRPCRLIEVDVPPKRAAWRGSGDLADRMKQATEAWNFEMQTLVTSQDPPHPPYQSVCRPLPRRQAISITVACLFVKRY